MADGPKFQLPSAFSALLNDSGAIAPEWHSFLRGVAQTASNMSRSGTTASRPTSAQPGRYLGQQYFDTDLGKPVFLKSVGPDVWVDGVGTVS